MAAEWEARLQELAPEHFGAGPEQRNFSVWSIVGQAPFNATIAPITSETCGVGAENPGSGYQALSLLTGGYRYPSCASDFTEMFQLMSQRVISGSKIPCAFDIPEPDNGGRRRRGQRLATDVSSDRGSRAGSCVQGRPQHSAD